MEILGFELRKCSLRKRNNKMKNREYKKEHRFQAFKLQSVFYFSNPTQAVILNNPLNLINNDTPNWNSRGFSGKYSEGEGGQQGGSGGSPNPDPEEIVYITKIPTIGVPKHYGDS
eukprot:TRINITY_DN3160_c0_g1_i2.p1 TRINITY_DN3160_c0_g1~~TRINITY_DN3160_c0_g1_i2.p1  ORF type:complete len:115 (+),score=24.52 TRINITY_DN3160_c0_g1_i2:185-529(+)